MFFLSYLSMVSSNHDAGTTETVLLRAMQELVQCHAAKERAAAA